MKNERVKDFILQTRTYSEITVENLNSKHYIMYRFNRSIIKRKLFVSAKIDGKYQYIGYFNIDDSNNIFTPLCEDILQLKIFISIVQRYIYTLRPYNDIIIHHNGMCAICNKRLTTPESIENGIGPVCLKSLEERKKIRRI